MKFEYSLTMLEEIKLKYQEATAKGAKLKKVILNEEEWDRLHIELNRLITRRYLEIGDSHFHRHLYFLEIFPGIRVEIQYEQ